MLASLNRVTIKAASLCIITLMNKALWGINMFHTDCEYLSSVIIFTLGCNPPEKVTLFVYNNNNKAYCSTPRETA
jgi:hypothetical protein